MICSPDMETPTSLPYSCCSRRFSSTPLARHQVQRQQIDQCDGDPDQGENNVVLDQQRGVEADQQNADNAGGEVARKQIGDPIVEFDPGRRFPRQNAGRKTPSEAQDVPEKLGRRNSARVLSSSRSSEFCCR